MAVTDRDQFPEDSPLAVSSLCRTFPEEASFIQEEQGPQDDGQVGTAPRIRLSQST